MTAAGLVGSRGRPIHAITRLATRQALCEPISRSAILRLNFSVPDVTAIAPTWEVALRGATWATFWHLPDSSLVP